MGNGASYGSGYEGAWHDCARCGTRRPEKTLEKDASGAWVCRPVEGDDWCERETKRKVVDRKGAEGVSVLAARLGRGG